MRKTVSLILLLFAVSCMAQELVPARREPIQKVQPNGDTLTVLVRGDEWHHWMMTTDRYRVQEGKKGYIYYSQRLLNGDVVPSKQKAHNPGQRKKKEVCWLHRYGIAKVPPRYRLKVDDARCTTHNEQRAPRMVSAHTVIPRSTVGKRFLPPRGLVILVNFQDVKFTTPRAEMDSMYNGQNYTRDYSYIYPGEDTPTRYTSQGSVQQYFRENSLGQYQPTFDLVGPVTVSQNMAYYGGNNASGNDKNPQAMITEACKLVKDSINYADYDADNDGNVDYIYVIYAGYGEADSQGEMPNAIWPHSSSIPTLTLDNKQISLYACGCELSYFSKLHDGIGTFCHEFSHVLGLPDIYETTGQTVYKTSGTWDIMDYGVYNNDGNTPCGYTAYERFFMGWTQPVLLDTAQNDTLPALASTGKAYMITADGTSNLNGTNPKPTEFYLLENRQRVGWDAYLMGQGMLITKVRYNASIWSDNSVNNNNDLHMDIIEADGIQSEWDPTGQDYGWYGKQGDCFPYEQTDFFTPYTAYPITNITQEENGNITFQFMGGKEPTAIDGLQCTMHNARFIYKGQIYIRKGGKTYNLLGHEVHLL